MASNPILQIGPNITTLPVVHGSGDFAWAVRQRMLAESFDCLAVPLPYSFQPLVQDAILGLPTPGIVIQKDDVGFGETNPWQGEWSSEETEEELGEPGASFVPIDPCQPVIAAIRTALGEHLPIRFIDLETSYYKPHSVTLPDSYALKQVSLEQYAASVLPFIQRPDNQQWHRRMAFMAHRLRELSIDFKNILFVASVLDWPWIRLAFNNPELERFEHEPTCAPERFSVEHDSLYFLLGEIPFITNLYEQARASLESDDKLSIDGVKELLISARANYRQEYGNRARKITPRTLATCMKYIRNLTLIDCRLSPQLITIVNACKQIVGDGYALSVLTTAKQYAYDNLSGMEKVKLGVEQLSFPDGEVRTMQSRLPGPPIQWSQLNLIPKPDRRTQDQWQQKWNPYSQCSWPPEDVIIENFRETVFDRTLETMGAELAKTEKFTTSVKDGIDIRDTIRHWYDGDIYVKTLPPTRGKLDCAVMLFDSPADPRNYAWRTTWFAEHKDESTLAFFATKFENQTVGPGICLATYGGILFLYPPILIPDIWSDSQFDFATTLEERLLAAACRYSECKHIALLSGMVPGAAWKSIARHYKKKLVHLPINRFSDSTIQQLRMVHVLNGKEIRSYAADFIRRV